ncbi:MAG: hypothetical protein HPY74_18985 [Firmicutes bacterium]|nr:hypothetical protein [Bacillota bacterium]
MDKVPGFTGEVRQDALGNIIGRLNQKTNGEIIWGVLQEDWSALADYRIPPIDEAYRQTFRDTVAKSKERYVLAVLPISPFSTARNLRMLENFLADVLLEPENVESLLNIIVEAANKMIVDAAQWEADGICIYDDWGTQQALLISPKVWRQLFKPVYKRLIDITHEHGMKFFMHSCGYIHEIMEDMIEISLDVFQLDQPELHGVEKLADKFGGRVTFWCPVDIQKIMQTGDRRLIEETARKMIRELGRFEGGFIAKDYPSWEDIDVLPEWAGWARDVFLKEGFYR